MKGAVNNATLPRFGGAELLDLRSSPPLVPGRGQIVVRVKAAGIHPIDIRRRAGYGRRMFSLLGAARLPLVLGMTLPVPCTRLAVACPLSAKATPFSAPSRHPGPVPMPRT